MNPHSSFLPRLRTQHLGALILLATAGTGHAADGDTLKATISSSVSYDSNIFRLPDAVDARALTGRDQRSDVITTTGAALAFDHPYGRQRVSAEARVTHNDFSGFDFLDNEGYDGKALLQWQVGNDWSGDLGYSRTRALTGFGDFRLPVKNLQTTQRTSGLAKYRLGVPLVARLQLTQTAADNSAAALQANDREERAYEAGVDFLPGSGNTLGVFVRHTAGALPNRPVAGGVGDEFDEDLLGTSFNWRLTGVSILNGYVGYTKRTYGQRTQRDYDGVSGRASYDWTPTGKSRLTLVARRQIEPYEDLATSYALTSAISAAVNWSATAKLTVGARAEYRRREFLGDAATVAPGQTARQDDTRALGVSIAYKAFRNVEFAAGAGRETRSSNRALLDYEVNTASVTAQLVF